MLTLVGIVTYLETQGYNLQSEYWKVANILILWPFLATTTKRLHDINKSAWWLLLNFIPVIGSAILFLGTSFILGSKETNGKNWGQACK